MKIFVDDSGDDEFDFADGRHDFGAEYDIRDYHKWNFLRPRIGYDYVDLGSTDYHFHLDCFDQHDYRQYFKVLKEISSVSIEQLINNSSHKLHFHIIPSPPATLRDFVSRAAGRQLGAEELPLMGQFALYTNPDGANRATNTKSPRIFFFVGPSGIFYISLYDPYHEIYNATRRN